MAERGEASRSSGRKRFGWFQRRRRPAARSRARTQLETRAPLSSRGELCQLNEPTMLEAASHKQFSWLGLFGRRSTPQRRSPRSRQTRDRMGQPPIAYPVRSSPVRSAPSRDVRTGRARPHQEDLSSRSRYRSHLRSLPPQSLANQPTLIQASTAFQQNTVLQDQDTLLAPARRLRSRKRENQPTRPQSRSLAIALYAARMLILSVGVGVLAGTVLSAWNPATTAFLNSASQPLKQASSSGQPTQPVTAVAQLPLSQELASMKTAVQGIAQQYPGFTPGVFLIDLDTNNFMDWSGTASFPAASTIKVPILIAFFQAVDAGKIQLDEQLTMRKDLIAPEAGDMQYLPVGAKFSALETATKMITISDNTATNMLIDRLGGIQAVNERFKSWGLATTQITNLLPDLKGTNTTSPKELASLMVRVSQGELVSLRSRDRLLDIMRRTINNSQLSQGLGEGATIAHKTGDIAGVIGDVGLIDMPSGKRYATAVLIRRRPNDGQAYDLVQKVSRVMYQNFLQSMSPKRPTPDASTTPLKPNLEPGQTTPDAQVENTSTPDADPTQAVTEQ